MSSRDIPSDLVELQRAFLAADAHCDQVAATHPRPIDVATGHAEISPAQRDELNTARAERLRLMDELQAHPWWAGVENGTLRARH